MHSIRYFTAFSYFVFEWVPISEWNLYKRLIDWSIETRSSGVRWGPPKIGMKIFKVYSTPEIF